jgi:hypothetical protein
VSEAAELNLVPGRECGDCTVCCVILNVDTPEFQKMPGRPCAHLCEGGGCGIHATRYPVCRVYHCGWRFLPPLSEAWRPDRSGVLVDFQHEDLPAHLPKRPGIRLTVFKAPEAEFQPLFLRWIAGLVSQDVPVVLAVPGPPGYFPAGALLNDALKDAVTRRDIPGIQSTLAAAFSDLTRHSFNPVVHRNAKP